MKKQGEAQETRFLLERKVVKRYLLLVIPLTFLFFNPDEKLMLTWFFISIVLGGLYALMHKLLFKYIFKGGPNVSSKNEDIKEICSLDIFDTSKQVVELGSGNGLISIALAKKGVQVVGVDISPTAVLTANIKAHLSGASTCKFKVGNMWKFDCSNFDVVIIYCIEHAMADLRDKLKRELKSGSYIVSNYFPVPGMKELYKKGSIYVYRI